jgi:hypothetical protein
MRVNKQLITLPAFLFIVPCVFGQEIHYNYDRGANFSAYRTYQWIEIPTGPVPVASPVAQTKSDLPTPPPNFPPPPPGFPSGAPNLPGAASDVRSTGSEDQLIDQDIRRAVDEQLARKGLTKVDKKADLQVTYHAAVHQELGINLSGSGWGGRGLGGWWDGSIQGQSSTIPVGTLVVDLYDPAKKQLIWRGDATKTIDLKKDPDKNYGNLQKAMATLFKNYPPTVHK